MKSFKQIQKEAAYINPQVVSDRWKQKRQNPGDAYWSRRRQASRILRAAVQAKKQAWKEAQKQGNSISAYFSGLGSYLQHKLRAAATEQVKGSQYNLKKYAPPSQPGDVIIAFAGARQGPGQGMDRYMAERYGKSNYAIFRPSQVSEALQFAKDLPKGSKLYVQGLSHGGAAAAQFAKAGVPIERLITYDPVSNIGKPQKVPQNVKKWYNAIAGDYKLQQGGNPLTKLVRTVKSSLSDVGIDALGRWGQIPGAVNIHVPQASHVQVDKMYNALDEHMKDVILRRKVLEKSRQFKKRLGVLGT